MRKRFVPTLAVAALALALGACGRETTSGEGAEQAQVVAAGAEAAPEAALQAQLEAAFLGKITPPDPDGYTDVYGYLDGDSFDVGAILVKHGRWTHAGEEHWVALVQRITGAEAADERGQLPAEIVSVLVVPTPRAGEVIFTEYCSHPDYAASAAHFFAIASPDQDRPGQTNPPTAAWRLDRATARLMRVEDAARVTCEFEHA